jgi:hypothetical protein
LVKLWFFHDSGKAINIGAKERDEKTNCKNWFKAAQ